ncbi:MAG: hypothetical protein WD100_10805 [Tistlia sp.]|uniref:hypothetical protein n=1 Tax=Tistlia sp. TaxID=3057121 RepID=UPI0034A301F4
MADPTEDRSLSDLAAREEIYEAMDIYGLTEAEEIAAQLGLPLEQVERVLRTLETELPLDDIEDGA